MRILRRSTASLLTTLALVSLAGSAGAQELFKEQPAAFGTQPCNGGGCWTNYMLLADIDNDGDLDVLFPNANGFFSKGQAEPFVMYKNNGASSYTEVSADLGGGYSGWLRQVTVADITGDGFVDIYAPNAWGLDDMLYINDGTGKFTNDAANRLPALKSHAGATRFGDVDSDGDMDLLVGDHWTGLNGGTIAHLYLNDGTGKFTEAGFTLPVTAQGDQPVDFDLFDMDGDFDLDLYINMHDGSKASVWRNDGTGMFSDATSDAGIPGQKANGYYRYGPVACDVDGDGDLDVWQDNAVNPGGREMLLINDGTGKFTDETSARVTGNPASDDNGLACVDVDGDGDFDVAIMSLGTPERVLINDGTGKFTFVDGGFTAIQDPTLWFEFGDLNGDGRLDVSTAQGEGNPKLNRVYLGTDKVPVDTQPPKIRAAESLTMAAGGQKVPFRFAVSDNATTDTGPRLKKAYLKVTSPSATEVPAVFMGGDLFRAELPAQSDGAMVSFEACAMDRQGNEGCSAPITYSVSGGGTGGTGGTGTGGTSTGGNTGGQSMGGAGTGGTTAGGGTGGGGAGFQIEDKGGCGCTVPGSAPEKGTLAFSIAGLLSALWLRRRRPRARP